MRPRPMTVTVAAVLMALIGLTNLLSPALPGAEAVPAVVIYGGIVLGVVGLVAVVGLWLLRRWGLWLTIVVSVLNIVSAAPGIFFAPTGAARSLAAIGVVVP